MHDKPAQQQPEEITINADAAFGVLMIVYIRGRHAGIRERLLAKLHSHATRLDYCK
jgi:hypothetical protein